MVNLLLPVGERRMSSWTTHQRRNPRSTEPGTDFYCPIGTPILAPADGMIYGSGNSIDPATGRWVGIEFTNGMSFREMHNAENRKTSGRVFQGDVIALSGASGYGVNDWSKNPATGGAHVHVTLWPTYVRRFGYQFNGKPWTVDFMDYVGGSTASIGGVPFDPASLQEEEPMFTIYRSGGHVLIVGNGAIMELGPHLTDKTGVQGDETLAAFIKAGAKVVDVDPRQYAVVRVNVIAGQPAPATGDIIRAAIKTELASVDVDVDDAVIDAIAHRVANEQDRRARERLGS